MPMTKNKLREALLSCESIVANEANKLGVTMAIRDASAKTRERRLSHLLWLAREGVKLVEDDRREKAMRWLGFIQGAITWGLELCEIDDLKDMNRPDESSFDGEGT